MSTLVPGGTICVEVMLILPGSYIWADSLLFVTELWTIFRVTTAYSMIGYHPDAGNLG